MEFPTSEMSVSRILKSSMTGPGNEIDTTHLTLLTAEDYTNINSTSYLSFKQIDNSATEKYILKK